MTIDLERVAAAVRARCPEAESDRGSHFVSFDADEVMVVTVWDSGVWASQHRLVVTPARISVLRAVLDAVDEQIGGDRG